MTQKIKYDELIKMTDSLFESCELLMEQKEKLKANVETLDEDRLYFVGVLRKLHEICGEEENPNKEMKDILDELFTRNNLTLN